MTVELTFDEFFDRSKDRFKFIELNLEILQIFTAFVIYLHKRATEAKGYTYVYT